MPSVPRLEPQIKQADLPSVRQDAAPAARAAESAGLNDQAFGAMAGAAKGVSKIFDEREDLARKESEKATTAWSQGIDDKALTEKKRTLFDPTTGVMTVGRGENAMPVTAAARVNYQKFLEGLAQTANGEDQKQLAKRILSKRYNDFDTDLLQHETSEQQALGKKKHESLVNTYRDEAVLNYRNPQRVSETLRQQEAAIKTYLSQTGVKGEMVDRAVSEERSKTLSNIVNRYLINNQDREAQQFYTANKDGFTGNDIDDVEKKLGDGTKKGDVFRAFDTITSKYEGLQNRREAASQMLKDRPDIRGEVDEKLVREQKIADMMQDDQRDQTYADTVEALAAADYDIAAVSPYLRHLSPRQQIAVRDKARKGLHEKLQEYKAAQRERDQGSDREFKLSERERIAQEREQRIKEHESDRNYTLAERQRREKERADKRAEKAREEKESNDWQPDTQKEFKYETMKHNQLGQIPESFLLQEVEPYVSDQSWNKIKSSYARAREEMGKPAKTLKAPRGAKAKDFQGPKLDDEVLSRLKAIPSTGIKDGDTGNEITNSKTKGAAARIFMTNLTEEYKKHFDDTGKYPSYDARQRILDKLTTEATFKKKKFFGLMDSEEKMIPGLIDKSAGTEPTATTPASASPTPVKTGRPFDSISNVERDPYLRIGKQGNLFMDPSTKKLISKDKIEARIVRAHEAKKRGASTREIIDILKKD